MRKFALLSVLSVGAALSAPVYADGGYAPGCPGGDTVRMSSVERERARAAHQTNDTNGGRSSIDKSCKTWEGGNTIGGPQPGTMGWRRPEFQHLHG